MIAWERGSDAPVGGLGGMHPLRGQIAASQIWVGITQTRAALYRDPARLVWWG